jgi:hypothetical protein
MWNSISKLFPWVNSALEKQHELDVQAEQHEFKVEQLNRNCSPVLAHYLAFQMRLLRRNRLTRDLGAERTEYCQKVYADFSLSDVQTCEDLKRKLQKLFSETYSQGSQSKVGGSKST